VKLLLAKARTEGMLLFSNIKNLCWLFDRKKDPRN